MVQKDVDRLMESTKPDLVHLLLDTGHLAFARANLLAVTERYGPPDQAHPPEGRPPSRRRPDLIPRTFRLSTPSRRASTYFTINGMRQQTLDTIDHQLGFLAAMGGTDLVVAEFGQAVNPLPVALFVNRPIFDDAQWQALTEGLNQAGSMAKERGMRLCYHPHMGTGVNIATDVDGLMAATDPDLVHLLLDTGHLAFAGADPLAVTKAHGSRIKHIHLKNVRAAVVDQARMQSWSFQTAVELGVFTVPGDPAGSIDFPPIFDALAAAGFEGWIVVEAEQDPAKATPAGLRRRWPAPTCAACWASDHAEPRRQRDIYFSLFMFTADMFPDDPAYLKPVAGHIMALYEIGYAGFDLPIAPTNTTRPPRPRSTAMPGFASGFDAAGLACLRLLDQRRRHPDLRPLVALPSKRGRPRLPQLTGRHHKGAWRPLSCRPDRLPLRRLLLL